MKIHRPNTAPFLFPNPLPPPPEVPGPLLPPPTPSPYARCQPLMRDPISSLTLPPLCGYIGGEGVGGGAHCQHKDGNVATASNTLLKKGEKFVWAARRFSLSLFFYFTFFTFFFSYRPFV